MNEGYNDYIDGFYPVIDGWHGGFIDGWKDAWHHVDGWHGTI